MITKEQFVDRRHVLTLCNACQNCGRAFPADDDCTWWVDELLTIELSDGQMVEIPEVLCPECW